MPISYHLQHTHIQLSNKDQVSSWITTVFQSESNKRLFLNFIFCDDRYLLKINKIHLGHSTLTDVITFNLAETDFLLESEIYISIDRVKENALRYNVSFDKELRRVMVHGVLHLLEYKDKTEVDKKKMQDMEDHWLSVFESRFAS